MLLCVLVIAVFVLMAIADSIQKDSGNVTITMGEIETDEGVLTYKLYRPASASSNQPAPGILLLHGYQNDKDTNDAFAIELSRRGYVVLSIDEFGHGSTTIGMLSRGYVSHRVKVLYGTDSEADGTFVSIGGPNRFKLLSNFSNLSFFDTHYTTDSDGNTITDSSMGGIAAYAVLAGFDFVDPTRLGVSGHSMGTWASWTVSAAYSGAVNEKGQDITPKATVLQCGELFTDAAYDSASIYFNNVMLLQAKYDEFNYFRDYANTVSDELLDSSVRKEFLGITTSGKWDTTYGSFSDGSARRIELLITNHRLTTHNHKGLAAAIDWFDNALGHTSAISSSDHVFMTKDVLQLLAFFCALAAMVPFGYILLGTKFFASVRQDLPNRPSKEKKGWQYWKGALITMLISCFTYPFMTQLGQGLLPLPENIFRMTIGNGFLSWYTLLIIIMLITTVAGVKKSKKKGDEIDYYDLGLSTNVKSDRLDWGLFGKSLLLSLCMAGLVYVLVSLTWAVFKLDFRFIWPFIKPFSLTRLVQFLVYIPVFLIFFVLNNSRIFAAMRTPEESQPGFGNFMKAWWKNALCMVGGVLIMVLIEYIPFFMNIGPGADLLFGSTFGGPFMSLMIVFVPQVLVLSIFCTIFYRKCGNVYVGGSLAAILACWIVTGGSAML
mgnify:CR=1 FL=1